MLGRTAARARIGIVSPWASRLGGGVFEAVVAHCAMLRAAGFDPMMFALADAHSEADRARFGETEVVTVPVTGPAMIGYSPGLVPAMLKADLDLVHLHGIWMYPSRAASDWARATRRPYMISPHGMLDPWIVGRGKLKKAVARAIYERRSWRLATRFHALTEAEAADICAISGRSEADVIPNAVAAATGAAERGPLLAYLGRIHPKKNIEGLVRAWREAGDVLGPIGARLRIAGWGDAEHVRSLESLIGERPGDGIEFLGPVYGEEKATLVGTARFLALPSHSEGLPVVILEAWAAGTPTLMTAHCHLPEGYAAGAAIDCGTDVAEIAAVLRRVFTQQDGEWGAMSAAATALARDCFSPDAVVRMWRDAYAAMLVPAR